MRISPLPYASPVDLRLPEDFQLGERNALSERYPAFRKQISALTRVKDQTQ